MSKSRQHLPESIKREVRRRCGYGCVLCGLPIFDYDHLEEWSRVKEHMADNVILLCLEHHGNKSRGRISKNKLKEAAKNPHNIKNNITTSARIGIIDFDKLEVRVAGNTHVYKMKDGKTYPVLNIESKNYISLTREYDEILPSIYIPDAKGRALLVVDRGELQVSTGVWDFNIVGKRVTMRSDKHDLTISMDYGADAFSIHHAKIHGTYGTLVELREDYAKMSRGNIETTLGVRESKFENVCLCATMRELFFAPINETGNIASSKLEDCVEDLLNILQNPMTEDGRIISRSNQYEMIRDLRSRSSDVCFASNRGLELSVRFSNFIISWGYFRGSDLARAYFNLASAKLKLYERKLFENFRDILSDFNCALKHADKDYQELEYAQLYAKMGEARVIISCYGGYRSQEEMVLNLQLANEYVGKATEVYQKQSSRFLSVDYPKTIEKLEPMAKYIAESLKLTSSQVS